MKRWLAVVLGSLVSACGADEMGTDAGLADAAAVDAAASDGGGAASDSGQDRIDAGPPSDAGSCPYPSGAVEPMAVGEVLWPYRWSEAIAADGTNVPIDLREVTCTADPNIDWSPFDLLVFISIPGW